jgi:cell division transport system permease protein
LFVQTFAALMSAPGSLITTWLVIGIALSLPLLLGLGLREAAVADAKASIEPSVSVYLSVPSDSAEAQELLNTLRGSSQIQSVTLVTERQALNAFAAQSGFGDILSAFSENPLPAMLDVKPMVGGGAEAKLLVNWMDELPGVDEVVFDAAWLARLQALMRILNRLVIAMGLLFSLGVILIIGNTLRLTIESQRSEIEISKLFGATDRFVQRPFIYRGFWLGLGGAFFAWLIVQLSLGFLAAPVEQMAQAYRSSFALGVLSVDESLWLLLVGAGLGISASWLSVWRHLKQIQPK